MFLGVDGGGTKTAFCLLRSDGSIAGQSVAPSSYYFSEGIDLVTRVLEEGIGAVCTTAGVTPAGIDFAFFGLPTYGEVSGDVATLGAAPRDILGHDRYRVDNDMVCGWSGSLGAADGINVISGTGSMTYGERAGRGHRVGGWSELFGDEGSAYWIAARGLQAFSRMSDGRDPAGPLLDVLREHLELSADLDLIDVVVNRWQGGRGQIAALCPQVVIAAERGDDAATAILHDAARELALLVDTTRRQLGYGADDQVLVSYSGGTFNAAQVRAEFQAHLHKLHDRYDLRRPLYSPVVGAALYAAKQAGSPLDADALERLRTTPTATAA
ncbi:N-acetylglucosamine kinase-like BadF-type ATPase [Asanoa ferruginea]|uniref:N-acetylglucosamine kinase-like BadF-type ATPase n=1 Tax=Asanoa ferruginea TaxID=53367 RepID=A0A3D9ZX66_9ACTN|nr:BadF/BadG/BcrA/BcrD ATPase family protein [Asanoa ferruginea]REG01185.1 N-acetylglucosamine kinase-like BadF-type ATPase [Asanoa ferruginea]GIF47105.1 N-acetylglucosamine kinase [Asanoa ferruginea]